MPDKTQIFCFSYAGGSAAFFDTISADLPQLELIKLEYPGHGTRHKEVCCSSFDELAEEMLRDLKAAYCGGDYALFGYSMGSITLVEVLRRILSDAEMLPPRRVFLAAHEPMTKFFKLEDPAHLDEWVKERTIRFGALPEKLIHNQSFWRMYLPLYRADYAMIGDYRFEDLDLKTERQSFTRRRIRLTRIWRSGSDISSGPVSFIVFKASIFSSGSTIKRWLRLF